MDKLNAEFLEEAARYFEKRPTGGEDSAHWSNVYNAENCRKASSAILAMAEENARLREALEQIKAGDFSKRNTWQAKRAARALGKDETNAQG